MVWKTAFACAPGTKINCTVIDNDLHYDLSSLRRSSDNYVIDTGDGLKSPKIVLNVCQSVIRQYGAVCPLKSGTCLSDFPNTDR